MDKIEDDLKALKVEVDKWDLSPGAQEGDYAELDDNNVVHLKRANGASYMMMSLMDYMDIVNWAIEEPLHRKVEEIMGGPSKPPDHIIFPSFELKKDKE